MRNAAESVICRLEESGIHFTTKPLIIGGKAMEYYGIRKAGADIDLVITDEDYQTLARQYPEKRKDLYGDLGILIHEFEIWRSIALLDYEFLSQDAEDCGSVLVVSLDRLLLMRVCAMEVEKYRKDLELMKEYYYDTFRNQEYLRNAEIHMPSYIKNHGVVIGGRYEE